MQHRLGKEPGTKRTRTGRRREEEKPEKREKGCVGLMLRERISTKASGSGVSLQATVQGLDNLLRKSGSELGGLVGGARKQGGEERRGVLFEAGSLHEMNGLCPRSKFGAHPREAEIPLLVEHKGDQTARHSRRGRGPDSFNDVTIQNTTVKVQLRYSTFPTRPYLTYSTLLGRNVTVSEEENKQKSLTE